MTADHLSYKRATSVCLIGLAIQAVLALVVLIYGILGSDAAAQTGAYAMLLGLPVWGALGLVFQQHRLERLEAMENESYAGSSAAASTVFEEAGGGDSRAQADRLAWMHKWFLPAVSLGVALAFLVLGGYRFLATRGQLGDDAAFAAPTHAGWAISLGVGVAVLGFIFARFIAGMAKQRVWALLHAGSASAVACALTGAALALAHFVAAAVKNESVLRYLAPAFGIVMAALGAEMVLNLLLNLYRPRVAGEYPRPAFDSRVLAFIAAPDRLAESVSEAINYQFGFNVSSTWFYRLFARSVIALVVLGGLVLWGMSVFTIVRPHERGLLLRNGQLVREVGPGLVIDLPWPFSRVERFSADAVNTLSIGTPPPESDKPILWTNDHTLNESYMLVQPGGGADARGTSDLNLLAIEVPVHYVVGDLRKFKALAQDGPRGREDELRKNLLTGLASSAVIEYVATLSVDEVLGAGRRAMNEDVRRIVQTEFDRVEAGVRVLFAGVAGAHPEKSVAPAFEDVVEADNKRLGEIEKAEADAVRTLAGVVGDVDRARSIIAELDEWERLKNEEAPAEVATKQEQKVNDLIAEAGGEAASLISAARAARWQTYLRARGTAASSEGLVRSFRAAPGPFMAARYMEALREGLKNSRVWITPPNSRVTINMEEQEPMVTGLLGGSGEAGKTESQ
jgi:regulator of protease activity HflC (stomatin/prohibitin superfamily)